MEQASYQDRAIPRDSAWDGTLAFRREGYHFVQHRCKKFDTDVFETRLMMRPTLCISGYEAARLFYDEKLFQREGGAPQHRQKPLFGVGVVQSLDDATLEKRKAMFMSLTSRKSVDHLAEIIRSAWLGAIVDWSKKEEIELKNRVAQVLFKSTCQWADVPVTQSQLPLRTQQMLDLIESGGRVGFRRWQARRSRTHLERWCQRLIQQEREGMRKSREGAALSVIAHHQEANGEPLSLEVGAVELLSLLRPTVTGAYYVVLCAMALHQFPRQAEHLCSADSIARFAQEVRRYYPFLPSVMAKVRKSFYWHGYEFQKGRRVMLDLYSTSRDERAWLNSEQFWPDRFIGTRGGEVFSPVPQVGGQAAKHHRSAAEMITLAIMKIALEMFTERMDYTVPKQDLRVPCNHVPPIPSKGFRIQVASSLP